MIIETCPKCGHDLVNIMLASNPPIPKKECWSCGWSWTGEPEKVERIPFGGNRLEVDEHSYLNGYTYLNTVVDEITEEEINEHLSSAVNTINTAMDDYVKKAIIG